MHSRPRCLPSSTKHWTRRDNSSRHNLGNHRSREIVAATPVTAETTQKSVPNEYRHTVSSPGIELRRCGRAAWPFAGIKLR
jgi:hypothetical protein